MQTLHCKGGYGSDESSNECPPIHGRDVRRAITAGLRLRGIDVVTAQEDGASELPDPELLDRATALSGLLFTQDDDLLHVRMAAQACGASWKQAPSLQRGGDI